MVCRMKCLFPMVGDICLVLEAVPAALFGILLFLVPETPRYLAMTHQDDKAFSVLEKVNGTDKAKTILSEIKAVTSEKRKNCLHTG